MRKEFEEDYDVIPAVEEKTALNLWKILYRLQDIYQVNFWDYYDSGSDFDKWCDSKGYGEIDPDGKERSKSNIWYAEQQKDIKEGLWVSPEYCCFIDMFMDDIQDLGNDETNEVYTVYLDFMLERAKEEDLKQFGKEDYRTKLAKILVDEFGESIDVTQLPE